MNVRILKRLRCPICKGELILHSFLEESIECRQYEFIPNDSDSSNDTGTERIIKNGVLVCPDCKIWYPIYSYVPVMLVFKTHFHEWFAQKNAEQLRLVSEYGMPTMSAQPGETSVQETFTDEWNQVQNNELSYKYSIENLKVLNEKVWLKWIGHSQGEIKSVLNIGCGLGRESIALQEILNGTNVFAIDLNFALLRSGEIFKSRRGIFFVIASLFHLPFKLSSFDLVYSVGVIHHTFSTYDAFKSIASYVRNGAYLFIWVYGLDDHLVRHSTMGRLTHAEYIGEAVLRPLVSRSPKILRDIFFSAMTLMCHPLLKMKVRHKASWNLRNTNHLLRNMLSHKYVHRHSYNELFEWFEDFGFVIIDVQSPASYRRFFQKYLSGIGMTGKKMK